MALALPYPSMNFVPLDVLTAEEMNHIVANYTFIANQFPLASSNIDWSNISTSGKFEFGNYLIQYGFETLPPDTANTWRDATFPTPFGSQPTLIGSINTVSGSETNAIITPRISEASTTGFRWACTYSGGYTNNQRLSWIAIGTKPSNNAKGPSEPEEQSRGVEEEPSPVEEPADENQR